MPGCIAHQSSSSRPVCQHVNLRACDAPGSNASAEWPIHHSFQYCSSSRAQVCESSEKALRSMAITMEGLLTDHSKQEAGVWPIGGPELSNALKLRSLNQCIYLQQTSRGEGGLNANSGRKCTSRCVRHAAAPRRMMRWHDIGRRPFSSQSIDGQSCQHDRAKELTGASSWSVSGGTHGPRLWASGACIHTPEVSRYFCSRQPTTEPAAAPQQAAIVILGRWRSLLDFRGAYCNVATRKSGV